MPIVKIKLTSPGTFAAEMKKRAAAFKYARIGARIQVPSDLRWWAWLEFGSATRTMADAPFAGGGAYPIKNIDRGDASTLRSLHWTANGVNVFKDNVPAHPGIRPHPFVRTAIKEIVEVFKADVVAALMDKGKDGYKFSPGAIQDVLLNHTMVYALSLIVANLATAAPGTREDGNLLGETASSVFEEEAEIVDGSDFSPGANAAFARAALDRASRDARIAKLVERIGKTPLPSEKALAALNKLHALNAKRSNPTKK